MYIIESYNEWKKINNKNKLNEKLSIDPFSGEINLPKDNNKIFYAINNEGDFEMIIANSSSNKVEKITLNISDKSKQMDDSNKTSNNWIKEEIILNNNKKINYLPYSKPIEAIFAFFEICISRFSINSYELGYAFAKLANELNQNNLPKIIGPLFINLTSKPNESFLASNGFKVSEASLKSFTDGIRSYNKQIADNNKQNNSESKG